MADPAKAQRLKELEEKKRRLQEYRQRKDAGPGTPTSGSTSPLLTPKAAGSPSIDTLLSAVGSLLPESPTPAKVEPVVVAAPVQARPSPVLSIHTNQCLHDIPPPPEVARYSKGTQTATSSFSKVDENEPLEDQPQQQQPEAAAAVAVEEAPKATLSEAEKDRLVRSEAFASFLQHSAKALERALAVSERVDLLVDYTKQDVGGVLSASQVVRERASLFSDLAAGRSVTGISWSSKHAELVFVSFSAPKSGMESDGLVLGFSTLNLLSRPEFVFTCPSEVTCLVASPHQANLVFGGCYSGEVVLWDTRFQTSRPIQSSMISSEFHLHPIQALAIVGTANVHNLTSLSADGKLCIWAVDDLSKPNEAMTFQSKAQKTSASALAALCLSFAPDANAELLIGALDGGVYAGNRSDVVTRRFSGLVKEGGQVTNVGHAGPVNSVQYHPPHAGTDLGSLFLTSSVDWTVKLWSVRKESEPLLSFSCPDYVFDAAWSPTHPAVFAAVDCTGSLSVWNLNEDHEKPVTTLQVAEHGVYRLKWSPDGAQLAVGDCVGQLKVYDVSEELTSPKADEFARFELVLRKQQGV